MGGGVGYGLVKQILALKHKAVILVVGNGHGLHIRLFTAEGAAPVGGTVILAAGVAVDETFYISSSGHVRYLRSMEWVITIYSTRFGEIRQHFCYVYQQENLARPIDRAPAFAYNIVNSINRKGSGSDVPAHDPGLCP